MKKDKRELMRVQTLIENDRMQTTDNFNELLLSDLAKLLSDFFDYRGVPELLVKKCGDRYKVEISIFASRIRSFERIPKQ